MSLREVAELLRQKRFDSALASANYHNEAWSLLRSVKGKLPHGMVGTLDRECNNLSVAHNGRILMVEVDFDQVVIYEEKEPFDGEYVDLVTLNDPSAEQVVQALVEEFTR